MLANLRYLLLQTRNPGDPMREAEVASFARSLDTEADRISVCDLLNELPSQRLLDACDVVLLGGSGHYSATGEGDWIERTLDGLRALCASGKPVFASCWGFQAIARALGGDVVKDLACSELGTRPLRLTSAGQADPVFGSLNGGFRGQMGHEDYVRELPPGVTLLASSDKVANQAYRVDGQPVYCTQFHPELNREDLLARVQVYPEYIERIAGLPVERFADMCEDTPETEALLVRFVRHFFGG